MKVMANLKIVCLQRDSFTLWRNYQFSIANWIHAGTHGNVQRASAHPKRADGNQDFSSRKKRIRTPSPCHGCNDVMGSVVARCRTMYNASRRNMCSYFGKHFRHMHRKQKSHTKKKEGKNYIVFMCECCCHTQTSDIFIWQRLQLFRLLRSVAETTIRSIQSLIHSFIRSVHSFRHSAMLTFNTRRSKMCDLW